MVEVAKRQVKEKLLLPLVKENSIEDDEMNSYFMDFEPNFDVIFNVFFILLVEYDVTSEVEDSDEYFNPADMDKYRTMCYYVTNYGCVDE